MTKVTSGNKYTLEILQEQSVIVCQDDPELTVLLPPHCEYLDDRSIRPVWLM